MENEKATLPPELAPEKIATWVRNDLANAITFLNLIRNDAAIMAAVTDVIEEKYKVHCENVKENGGDRRN